MIRFRAAIQKGLVACILFVLFGCEGQSNPPLTIAVNPWPGYSFLYLAESEGFFKRHGLNIKIVSVDSLSDARRAFIHGRVDGMASTVVESVHAHYGIGRALSIVLISDYSNGGDVILATSDIRSVKDLKGKRVGCEVGSLGVYMLERALAKNNFQLSDVEVVHVEQHDAKKMLGNGEIDAYVTYPPVSIELVEKLNLNTIFSSADIPAEVIDTISIDKNIINDNPHFYIHFREAWQDAVNYYHDHPIEASNALSKQLGVSPAEFNETLKGLVVVDGLSQSEHFKNRDMLTNNVRHVCKTLVYTQTISGSCDVDSELFVGP